MALRRLGGGISTGGKVGEGPSDSVGLFYILFGAGKSMGRIPKDIGEIHSSLPTTCALGKTCHRPPYFRAINVGGLLSGGSFLGIASKLAPIISHQSAEALRSLAC
jgi:hypothetical protein